MTNQERTKFIWQLLNYHHRKYCSEYFSKYDLAKVLELPNALLTVSKNQNEAVNYHKYLLSISEAELNLEYKKYLELIVEEYEKGHKFNSAPAQMSSQVIEFFGRAEYWTLGEAAALINERNPKIVTHDHIENDDSSSTTAKNLKDTLELLERAKNMGRLSRTNTPANVIEWVTLKGIYLSPALVEAVRKFGKNKIDVSKENTDLKDQVTTLQNQISELTKEKPKVAKQPSSKERDSLLKIILAMAIKGYAYDSNAPRSNLASEVVSDAQLLGLSIDEDTVRKYLNEAKATFSDKLNRTE